MAVGRRYVVGELLGQGGAARVHRAYDRVLAVERAIKTLSPERKDDALSRTRFLNEARTMASLHHPNIVAVQDIGEEDGAAYMVMELVDGWSLADRVLGRGPLAPREAAWVLAEVLGALDAAHRGGVVHRDVKPHNILLTRDGIPKLTDFGIARNRDIDTITRPGVGVGTAGYMSPEQRSDAAMVGPTTDVYAAGATLWFVLTGRAPGDLYDPQTHGDLRDLPPELGAVIVRATRRIAGERYASASEMAIALQALLPELPAAPLGAPPIGLPRSFEPHPEWVPGAPEAPARPVRRPWIRVAVLSFGVFGAGGLLLVAVVSRQVGDREGGSAVILTEVPQETGTGLVVAEPPAVAAEPAVDRARPAPAAPAASGARLAVNSVPWSRVFVDDVEVGHTAWSGPLQGGTHTVRLLTGDGDEHVRSVRIAGEDTRMCWDFQIGGECL